MFRFYLRLLRDLPSVFRESWETSAFWLSLVLAILATVTPVLIKSFALSGWYALIPLAGVLSWAVLRANYRQFERLEANVERSMDQKARQIVVNQLADFRMEACNLLAEPVRNDLELADWTAANMLWAERVGPVLEKKFSPAVRRKFDFVGLHPVHAIANAYSATHNDAMSILDHKIKVLEKIIGDGIAETRY